MGGRGGSSGGMGQGGNRNWNNSNTVRSFLQSELDKYGLGVSKESLVNNVYNAARANGANVTILNDKYIIVTNDNGSAEFSFTKSKADGKWKLTPNLKYGDVTKGRHNGYTMYRAAGQWFSHKENAEWAAVSAKLDGR